MEALGGPAGQEVLERLATMDRRALPDDEQLAGDRAQQHAQEAHDIRRVGGLVVRLQEHPPVGREPPEGGQMVRGQRHPPHRRPPARRPGAHGPRQEVEAGLVSPDDRPPVGDRFFSTPGRRSCPQAAIAAASRWVARVTGRWTRCCSACSRRLTWAGWDVTPNVRRSTSVTRWPVHTWPRNPYASAPWVSKAGIWARCSALSLGCGPGAGWRLNASTPASRARFSHWLTAPAVTPSAAAISCCFHPCSCSSQARPSPPSRLASWAGFVFIAPASHLFTPLRKRQ